MKFTPFYPALPPADENSFGNFVPLNGVARKTRHLALLSMSLPSAGQERGTNNVKTAGHFCGLQLSICERHRAINLVPSSHVIATLLSVSVL